MPTPSRDFDDYPSYFFTATDSIYSGRNEYTFGTMLYNRAMALRTEFYRWRGKANKFGKVRLEPNADSQDVFRKYYAEHVGSIANQCKIETETLPSGTVTIKLVRDPLISNPIYELPPSDRIERDSRVVVMEQLR